MANLQSEFIALLTSHGVDYLIVGGHAVAFHGHPRYTGDIDFFVRASADNARRVLAVLEAFGFGGLGITDALRERPRLLVVARSDGASAADSQ